MNKLQVKKRKLWVRVLHGAVMISGVIFITGTIAWLVMDWFTEDQFRKEINRIRAAGEPVMLDDFPKELSDMDPIDNAGRYYRAAVELLIKDDRIEEIEQGYFEALKEFPAGEVPDEVKIQAQEFLEKNRLVLEMVDKGAACSECVFNISSEDSLMSGITDLPLQIRYLEKLLAVRTEFLLINGEDSKAVDSVISMLRLTRVFEDQPETMFVIGFKIGCLSIATPEAIYILQHGQHDEEVLIRLEKALSASEHSLVPIGPILAERARICTIILIDSVVRAQKDAQKMMTGFMENLLGESYEINDESTPRFPGGGIRGIFSFWCQPIDQYRVVKFLQDMNRLAEIARSDWPDVVDGMKNEANNWTKEYREILPGLAHQTMLMRRVLADLRCTRAAVIIERYRKVNKRLPGSLFELAEDFGQTAPIDPSTGKELIYKYEEESYVVYSLESNKIDDGGTEEAFMERLDWGVRIRLK